MIRLDKDNNDVTRHQNLWSDGDRIFCTPEEAKQLLPKTKDGFVHVFLGSAPSGLKTYKMIDAEWSLSMVHDALRYASEIQISDSLASQNGHGLCIRLRGHVWFIETREDDFWPITTLV